MSRTLAKSLENRPAETSIIVSILSRDHLDQVVL